MRSFRAGLCLRAAIVAAVSVAALVGASSAWAFGVAKFEAGTCSENTEPTARCTYATPEKFYTQAAGRPNFGITEFVFKSKPNLIGQEEPEGSVKNIRVDLPPGLSVNPQATETECNRALLAENKCTAGSEVGENLLVVYVPDAVEAPVGSGNRFGADVPISGKAYNLEPQNGVPLEIGVEIDEPALGINEQVYLVGGVSWHAEEGISPSGDYHEFFTISDVSNAAPLLSSRLIFKGQTGKGFITMPSVCGPATTMLHVESYEGQSETTSTTPPANVSNCNVPKFEPKVKLTPSSAKPDVPDAATVDVTVPQHENGTEINSSALKEARVTLPEGMTLNPSAASGLVACTDEQFGKGTAKAVECPTESRIGAVRIETPTLPAGALTGSVYVGAPLNNSPSSGEDYRIFINAESAQYGVTVRLEGKVFANEATGQLTTLVAENPQIPFREFVLELSGGSHTPLANPNVCGTASGSAALTPFTTGTAGATPLESFTVECSAIPFNLSQSTSALPTTGGSTTTFTLGLTRADGNQYLKKVSAELPVGMVAKIPSVPQCGEPAAKEGKCAESSRIGTVRTSLGSGPAPYPLEGKVYLTGPYNGAPFGLSIVVPAEKVGPYNYGKITTQAGISINPYTARVTVAGEVPTIVGGVPLRMKALTIAVEHPNFMLNPTNCGVLSTNTTLTSTTGGTDSISTPFQATGCSSLGFKPKFSYSTNAYTTKRFGASLNVKLSETAGNANIKSVKVTLPMKMPSREVTLKMACPEKTFAANPSSCSSGSQVGTAKITTPTLPGTLEGPAYFVSHGGAAFPDLDLVVKGDGVTVILVGNTNISKGITHTTFAALPDVPVNSFELNLPTGEKSALGAAGNFCKNKMYIPTTVTGQNGTKINEKIQIHVAECPVKVVGHKVKGNKATITAAVSSAGRLSTSGRDLVVVHKKIAKAVGNAKIEVRLSKLGKHIVATKRQLDVKVRVGFKASTGAKRESKAYVKLVFRS